MNRIDRLTAILIHLQSKQIVKAEEIADRFNISKRTVYRDLRALEEAGVPLGAEAGKGYYLCDGYYLPPVMFTKKEATSMLLAGKLVEKLTDEVTTNDYQSALFKIKSVLSNADKEFLTELNSFVDIKIIPAFSGENGQCNYLTDIQHAIVSQKVLCIDYHSYYKNESIKNRLVEPIGLCYYGNTWHLIAFCRYRNDYRDFRADRIEQLSITETSFERDKLKSMDKYFQTLIQSNDIIEIIVRFDKKLSSELRSQKYYFGFISEKIIDNRVEMAFLNDSVEYVGNWLLRFGKNIEIVKPRTLIDHMKSIAKELSKHYLS